ncbi:MAG: GNAT family N-acetyltransferase [bacterium]|nr:GNAT family N-acetyltransferase [bacterium]
MQIRNYTENDFADILRIGNELDLHGQIETEDDQRVALSLPRSEPGKDIFIVVDSDETVGYARVSRNRDMKVNRHNFNMFAPGDLYDNSTIIDELIGRCEARIREIAAEYGDKTLKIKSWCYEEEEKVAAALERNDYENVRFFARMDLNDISNLPESKPYDDVTIRLFDRAKETEAFAEAMNRGFEGHYEHHAEPVEMYEVYLDTHWFQPENVFVAEGDGELVGVCWNYLNPGPEADGFIWGVVSDLAVIPVWRGKGLGRALIRRGHLALREHGAEKICLWVDYANPFGAKKLYYSEGYTDRYISVAYAKDG